MSQMIDFEKTIGESEARHYYLNLTDNDGKTYGSVIPTDKTRLWIIANGIRYKASRRSPNQIKGALRRWFSSLDIREGDLIRIRYNPECKEIDGRVPVEIDIIERADAGTISEHVIDENEEVHAEVSVRMERDLEDFLAENLHLLGDGLELFVDEDGRSGRQYPTDVGTIDLLCTENEGFAVVELKKGRSSDRVVGQVSRYMGWVEENICEGGDVRGIIVVHDFNLRLKYAVAAHENLGLMYYRIQIEFISEEEVIERQDVDE